MKIRRIKDPVYGRILYLAWDYEVEEADAYIKKKYGVDSGIANFWGACHLALSRKESLVRHYIFKKRAIKDGVLRIGDYGDIAHEVVHYCVDAFDEIGIKLEHDNDEALAYYFAYIYEQILAVLYRDYKKEESKDEGED